jgi:hypothetical protein
MHTSVTLCYIFLQACHIPLTDINGHKDWGRVTNIAIVLRDIPTADWQIHVLLRSFSLSDTIIL